MEGKDGTCEAEGQMMDIVELLRERNHGPDCKDAADEIERLRTAVFAASTAAGQERLAAQNARRRALEEAADICFALRFKNPNDGEAACNECGEAIRALSAVEKGTESG